MGQSPVGISKLFRKIWVFLIMETETPEQIIPFGDQLMEFFENGEITKGIEFAEVFIDDIRMRLGSEDELEAELALALESQSDFYRSMGEDRLAEQGYLEGLHFLKRNEGFEVERARINSSLAVLYDFGQEPGKAKRYYLRAIEHFESLEPTSNLDVADFCNNLAFIYEAEGNFDEAENSFKRALTLTQAELGMDDEMTALRYNNLGTFYFKRDEQARAKELHLTALNVRKRLLGERHVDTAESHHNYALVMVRQGRVDEGFEHFELALRAFEKNIELARDEYETVAANYRDVLESLNELGAINDLDNRVEERLQNLDGHV